MLSKYKRLHLFPVPSTMAGNLRDHGIHLVPRMMRGMPTSSWIYC
jgi:hypothetical protein